MASGPSEPRIGRVHSDAVVAGVVIAVCLAVYAATFGFDTVPLAIAQGMGPEAFPRLVLWVILALAVLLAWQARSRHDAAREQVPPMVLYTGLILFAFVPTTYLIGLLPASFVLLVGLGRVWGARSWLGLSLSAVLFCAATWAVFARGFGVQFPAGLVRSMLGSY